MPDPTVPVYTSLASASEPPAPPSSPSPVSQAEKDILAIYARLQELEARALEDFRPRLEALEEAVQSLAKRAESGAGPVVMGEIGELKSALASLGGIAVGQTGHDSGAFFHSWWDRVRDHLGVQQAPRPLAGMPDKATASSTTPPASTPPASSTSPPVSSGAPPLSDPLVHPLHPAG
jgi:hypothetical protein